MDQSPAGELRVEEAVRSGECGRWFRAVAGAGHRRGALLLDPAKVAAPGALDRVAAVVAAVRRLNLPGVLRTADAVQRGSDVWLITAVPASPTVAELLSVGAAGLEATGAALLAGDVGRTLLELHRAGLVHGRLGPHSVVVTAEGGGSLIEVGLAAALRGESAEPGADIVAWAALVRTLGDACAPPAAELFAGVAAQAASGGLAPALEALTGAAARLPGFPDRAGLVALAAVALPAPEPSPVPRPRSASESPPMPPSPAPAPAPSPPEAEALVDPADLPTQAGKRVRRSGSAPAPVAAVAQVGDASGDVRLRFGPGVPAGSATQAWRGAPTRRRAPRRRLAHTILIGLISGVVTFALVVAVAVFVRSLLRPLAVTSASVAVAKAPGNACDVTVDVVGTVMTNGEGGTFSYQWMRSDGQVSAVLEQSVADGETATQVHLYWTFSGTGRYEATATLRVLTPAEVVASGEFIYACPGARGS